MTGKHADRGPGLEPTAVDLVADGLLWMINTTILHPRGFALAVHGETKALGLVFDGTEVIVFPDDPGLDAKRAAFEAALARTAADSAPRPPPRPGRTRH